MKNREVETAGNARNNNAFASNAPKTQQRAQPQPKQQTTEEDIKRQYLQDPDGQAEIIAGLQVLKKIVDAYDMTKGAVAARNQGKNLAQLGFSFVKQVASEIESYFDPTASARANQNAVAPNVENAVRSLSLNNPKERVFLKQNSEKLKTIRELFSKEQLKPFAQRAGFTAGTEDHYLDFLYSNQWEHIVWALFGKDGNESSLDKATKDAQKIDASNAAKALQWDDGTQFFSSSVRDTDTLRTLGKSGKELGKMMANVGDTVTDIGYKIRSLVGENNHQPIEGINPEWHINHNGVKERYDPATTNELSNLRRIYDQCQTSYKTLIALANKVETNSKEEYDIIKGYVDANPKYESPQNIEQLKNVLLTHPAGLTSSYAQPQQ